MPYNLGKTAMLLCRSNITMALVTATLLTPHNTDLASKISSTTGPIKNVIDARPYLEQRSLIAIDNNFSIKTLANLLITTSHQQNLRIAW